MVRRQQLHINKQQGRRESSNREKIGKAHFAGERLRKQAYNGHLESGLSARSQRKTNL